MTSSSSEDETGNGNDDQSALKVRLSFSSR